MKKLVGINQPYISHFYHSNYPFNSAFKNFQLRKLLLKYGFFKYVFCSSKSLLNYLIKIPSIDPDNMYYVPYPIDTDRFKPQDKQKLRHKYVFSNDSPIIRRTHSLHPRCKMASPGCHRRSHGGFDQYRFCSYS